MVNNSKIIVSLIKATEKISQEMTEESALDLLTSVGVLDKERFLTTNYHSKKVVQNFKKTTSMMTKS